jgi:hypothetical protein
MKTTNRKNIDLNNYIDEEIVGLKQLHNLYKNKDYKDGDHKWYKKQEHIKQTHINKEKQELDNLNKLIA